MTVMGFHALLIVFSLHGLNTRRCACVPVQLPSTLMTSQKLFLETITDSSPLWLRRWTATAVPWVQAHQSDNDFVLFSFFAFLFVLFAKENSIDCISISFDHRPFLFRQLYCPWSYLQSHSMPVGAHIKLMIAV